MDILAIIPSRSGSKGIPNKNLSEIKGRSLIQITIDSLAGIERPIHSVFTTDCDDYIIHASKNCEIDYCRHLLHKRPLSLASDTSLTLDVVLDAVKAASYHFQRNFSHYLLLQPTCPFRSSQQINQAISSYERDLYYQSIASVISVDAWHPLRMKRIVNGELVNLIDTGHEDMRPRQSLPKVYIRSGDIYMGNLDAVFRERTLLPRPVKPFLIEGSPHVNIDTEIDLLVARLLAKEKEYL